MLGCGSGQPAVYTNYASCMKQKELLHPKVILFLWMADCFGTALSVIVLDSRTSGTNCIFFLFDFCRYVLLRSSYMWREDRVEVAVRGSCPSKLGLKTSASWLAWVPWRGGEGARHWETSSWLGAPKSCLSPSLPVKEFFFLVAAYLGCAAESYMLVRAPLLVGEPVKSSSSWKRIKLQVLFLWWIMDALDSSPSKD